MWSTFFLSLLVSVSALMGIMHPQSRGISCTKSRMARPSEAPRPRKVLHHRAQPDRWFPSEPHARIKSHCSRVTAKRCRSSILTVLSASKAVEERSTLLACQYSGIDTAAPGLRAIADLGTTLSPSRSDAISASFHLRRHQYQGVEDRLPWPGRRAYRSTHRHHLHPPLSPGKPGRAVIRSLPVSRIQRRSGETDIPSNPSH